MAFEFTVDYSTNIDRVLQDISNFKIDLETRELLIISYGASTMKESIASCAKTISDTLDELIECNIQLQLLKIVSYEIENDGDLNEVEFYRKRVSKNSIDDDIDELERGITNIRREIIAICSSDPVNRTDENDSFIYWYQHVIFEMMGLFEELYDETFNLKVLSLAKESNNIIWFDE